MQPATAKASSQSACPIFRSSSSSSSPLKKWDCEPLRAPISIIHNRLELQAAGVFFFIFLFSDPPRRAAASKVTASETPSRETASLLMRRRLRLLGGGGGGNFSRVLEAQINLDGNQGVRLHADAAGIFLRCGPTLSRGDNVLRQKDGQPPRLLSCLQQQEGGRFLVHLRRKANAHPPFPMDRGHLLVWLRGHLPVWFDLFETRSGSCRSLSAAGLDSQAVLDACCCSGRHSRKKNTT
jgi:hypothetical protein